MGQYPTLPLKEWEETKTTLHLFAQIVGKVRLTLNPGWNHWWHVPLYVSARGLTTGSIPIDDRELELEFDFPANQLAIRTSDGRHKSISLVGTSVAEFYRAVMESLAALDIQTRILAVPFDPSKTGSDIPFAKDDRHKTFDPEAVARYWQILIGVDRVFKIFRSRFRGKCSPVHLFWHSFDLAVTRFSGKLVPVPEDADPVTREAYSHEVISFGFWPGDDNMPEPAFYAYAAPEPAGLSGEPLRPGKAWWQDMGGSHMALFKYKDYRNDADPAGTLLEFLQSSYEAGAKQANWPRAELDAT